MSECVWMDKGDDRPKTGLFIWTDLSMYWKILEEGRKISFFDCSSSQSPSMVASHSSLFTVFELILLFSTLYGPHSANLNMS